MTDDAVTERDPQAELLLRLALDLFNGVVEFADSLDEPSRLSMARHLDRAAALLRREEWEA